MKASDDYLIRIAFFVAGAFGSALSVQTGHPAIAGFALGVAAVVFARIIP